MSLKETQEVERLYINMEQELLLNIAKKLAEGKPMEIDKWDLDKGEPIYGSGGVNEWQLERLKELNGLNEENAKIIAGYSQKTVEEVEKVFERAREIGTEADKKILEMGIKTGILNEVNPIYENTLLKSIISRATRNILTTFNNINNSLLASAGDNYKQIVNEVSIQVLSGTKTTMRAMQEAVTKLANNGLTSFTARNGAEWTPEAYIKMVMRTNTQNTINEIQEERLKLRRCDYVEISSHSGARPLCADDQGQIFSLSGDTSPIKDGKGKTIRVRSWSSSSYGKPAGILGINCGHTRHPFVPGLSIHREMTFSRAENDEDYQERVIKSNYERAIRHQKQEIEMLKVIGAEDNYIKQKRSKLRERQNDYIEFLNKTGRTRVKENEWISKTSLTEKTNDKAINNYQKWSKKENKLKQKKEIIKKSTVGKFNISKYTSTIKTNDSDVVLLEERISHIKERHPEVEGYVEKIPKILNSPDMILQELKREDTVWIIKKLEKNIKVTIKMNTSNNKNIKNSIIQMQFMRDSEIKRNIKNDKVKVLFDKNEKK